MERITLALKKPTFKTGIIIDLIAITLVYMVPTISHWLMFPVYLIEPMRLMLIIAIAHTNKYNAYLLALTLPLFSFMISAHPVFPKMLIIMIELVINVWVFYRLRNILKSPYIAVLLSIIISKVIYYLMKFTLIQTLIIDSGLFSTPIWIQGITTIVFSLYLGWQVSRKLNMNKTE